MKHTGSLEDLLTTIKGCGFSVDQVLDQEHGHQVRTSEGAIVNWYPSKGTLVFQGIREQREKIQSAWASYTGAPASPTVPEHVGEPEAPANPATANKKVFLVHGHDVAAREQLELVLHKLGLDPFVLANTGGGGLTIIEALEAEIGPRNNQARFGIVLMTPDDMGYSKADGSEAVQPRARQNVVLETGMLISAVGRPNVAILKRGHLEVPSDAQGILYIPFNDHVKEVVPKLADRLRAAGFVLSPDAITRASS
ncbi:nucleotide-binding protein [Stenotrophomonas sp. CFBP 13724]|uniref:TIR domain-containing protein n=1 Tax=Stenotrophomonas sp. CFBP 13724 TaxID=2775298 RepID=UPI001780C60D|nr:nucleotide-binding protein [Stenotrophomonas sp. CFBP 13724]MBD8642360.1 nucleotide-binding protein [Stenotrophomonas sp. CFBP 13724]